MQLLLRIAAAALVALALAAGTVAAQDKSLYLRLGSYDAIAAILDDFGTRLGADEQMQRFSVGHSQSSQIRQRQLVLDLVCQMTGGPCFYIGRDIKTAHGGLGVTKADWDRAMTIFSGTLDKFKVGAREQKELIALITPFEKDIVEQ